MFIRRFLVFSLLLCPSATAWANQPFGIFILHSYSREYPRPRFLRDGFSRLYQASGNGVKNVAVATETPIKRVPGPQAPKQGGITLAGAGQHIQPGQETASFYQQNQKLVIGTLLFLLTVFLALLTYFLVLLSRKNLLIRTGSSIQKELEAMVDERTRALLEEQHKLSKAQAISHIGNYVWQVTDNATSWSNELYRILGRKPDGFEASYDHYVSCIHDDDKGRFLEFIKQTLETNKPHSADYRILRPNGEICYVHDQAEAKLENGQQILTGVIQDITRRKHAQIRLQEERDFNETVLETAGNVIVILDLEGCFVRFNRAAELLTGYSSDEVLGKPVWNYVIPQEQMAGVRRVFENLRQGKTDIASEYENDWLTRDGERRTLHWHNTVLRDSDGNVTHIVTLGYDLTERLAVETERERLQRELSQARKMEALGQLTGGIAHDFNNMLGIIIGYNDLALDQYKSTMDDTLRTYLENINIASQRARDLVKQMMVYSHKEKTEKRPQVLPSLVQENVNMLRKIIPSSIKINLELEHGLPHVLLDSVQLQQMIMNLCLNARDAMRGAGVIDIRLGWRRNINRECNACHKLVQGDWIELAVSDNGSGMDAEVVERIFEPFFTTKDVGQGTGMGMSVLQAIVNSHNGHVFIDTQKNQGARFQLLFPPLPATDENGTAADHGPTQSTQGYGQHILVVDDEPALTGFMNELLSDNGYYCTCSNSSPEALETILQAPDDFDLVITDQTMPDLTGLEMIAKIRALIPGMPVILATGYSENIDAIHAKQLAIHFLDKPVTAATLLDCVARALTNAGNQAPPA